MNIAKAILQSSAAPLAHVYRGASLVFLVPREDVPLPEGVTIFYPESKLDYRGQRNFVKNLVKTPGISVIVTKSPVILSDAIPGSLWVGTEDGWNPARTITFGDDPGNIAINLLGEEESIGALSDEFLRGKISEPWTKPGSLPELQTLVENIGGGYYRSELRTAANKLAAKPGK